MRLRFVILALVVCMWAGSAFGQDTITWGTTCSGCSTVAWLGSASSKTVEPLNGLDKAALTAARKKLEAAKEELATVEQSVKKAHGEQHNLCYGSETYVTFFGDYALVDTEPTSGCVSSGTLQMNAVPSITYPFVPPTGTAAPGGVITAQ